MRKLNVLSISVSLTLLFTLAMVSFGASFEPTKNVQARNAAAAQLTDAQKLKIWDAEEMKRLPRTVNGTKFMFTTLVCPTGCTYKATVSKLSIRGKTPGINGLASINKAKSHRPALLNSYCRSKGLKYGLPMSIYINNGANTTFHPIHLKPSDCPTTPTSGAAALAYWSLVKNSKRVSDFRSYLRSYPTGAHVPHAKLKISQLSGSTTTTPVPTPTPTTSGAAEQAYWNLVKTSKRVSDFRRYLTTYPTGAHVPHAKLKISQLSGSTTTTPVPTPTPTPTTSGAAELAYWNLVKTSKRVSDFRRYLTTYPTGAHVPHANLKISQLSGSTTTTPVPTPTPTTSGAAELAYWNLVKTSKRVSDFRRYLTTYPTGAHVPHANLKISQLGGGGSTGITNPPLGGTVTDAQFLQGWATQAQNPDAYYDQGYSNYKCICKGFLQFACGSRLDTTFFSYKDKSNRTGKSS